MTDYSCYDPSNLIIIPNDKSVNDNENVNDKNKGNE